jgi:glyoxylase-like metal-dependent hydrolase (beta-lactamase superfamily II)
LFTSRRWTAPKPINVYVVEHREGLVLFDTGQDRASVTDPDYFPHGPTGLLYRRPARFDIDPGRTLSAGLAQLGHHTDDVHTAVLSHLHQHHIGGLPELTGADVVITAREWRTLARPAPEARGLLRSHIDLPGLRWRRIEPEPLADPTLAPFSAGHDLFGDGSIVLIPTPGHTPGSQSMLVRRPAAAPLLKIGDLSYDLVLLASGELPGVGTRRLLRVTTAMVNALHATHPDLVVLPSHDLTAASRLEESARVAGARR